MIKNKIDQLASETSKPDLIREAFRIAEISYSDKKRFSGEKYIDHCLRIAQKLREIKLDPETIAASFLYNVLENKPESQQKFEIREIEKRTNKEVAFLVKKAADLEKIPFSLYEIIKNQKKEKRNSKKEIENFKNMFLAVAEDLRVVLIKLVSRLDNLNSLGYLPLEKQKLFAIETLSIFVPIADKLGIHVIKSQLEDLAFKYLYPDKYKWIEENIKKRYEEREKYLKNFSPKLKSLLRKNGVKFLEINHRAKSYWSTYQKLIQYNMDLEKIHDLIALRVIVKDIKNCYEAVGVIHKKYPPIIEELDDFIANPKPNGYQSLHTTTACEKGEITEIQIRTASMHKEAEYGICAHWAYKERNKKEEEILEWKKEIPKILENFEITFFKKKIFIFTPKGNIIKLPKGSTPVDFAYAVHTNIGYRCEEAKINGKMASLSTPLKNADVVEIITNKNKKPSQDWLNFVRTNFAKNNIRKSTKEYSFQKFISPLRKLSRPFFKKEIIQQKPKKLKLEVSLGGEKGNFLIRRSKCCSPEEGDDIKAYITKSGGASLHKTSCPNFKKLSEKFPNRIINSSWIKD